MARKFITERELQFISVINKELIQNVVGQEVNYYAVSERTRTNLYGEAVQKIWNPPIAINARVLWENPTVETKDGNLDNKYTAEVYFHTDELNDRNVRPREGDFVEFGQVFFEITSVTHPQIVFGQVQQKIMTKCMCVMSREGQFQAGNVSSQSVDHSHPVEDEIPDRNPIDSTKDLLGDG